MSEKIENNNDGPIKDFHISIENNAKSFCGLINGLSTLFEDINIRFSKNGLNICEIDDGRIGLMRLFVDQYDLNDFSVSEEFNWSVDIGDLNKILYRFSKNDSKIEILKKSEHSIEIRFSNDDLNDTPRTFILENITIEENKLNWQAMEELSYLAHIEIPLGKYSRLLKDADFYSETLELTTIKENNIIKASAEGYQGEFFQNMPNNLIVLEDVKKDFKTVLSIYYLKILEKIGKCFGTSSSKAFKNKGLKLHFGLDATNQAQPLKAEFELFTTSFIKFWLAPRVEDYDEDYGEEEKQTQDTPEDEN